MTELLGIPSSERRGFRTADDQAVAYVEALKASREADDLLASLNSRLKSIGSNLAALGRELEGTGGRPLDWLARNFDCQSFESEYAAVPALLEEYKLIHAKRVELEVQLSKYSWHKKSQ